VFAILLHLFQFILIDDGVINQMLEIWVVCVDQLKLVLIIQTLKKHILLLLVGVDIVDGVRPQLNEHNHVFIHHHAPLVQI
jgi:hypothetical protein